MVNEIRRNRSFNGSSYGTLEGTLDISGYLYNRLVVNGDLSVKGDLDCNELMVNGTFRDEGILKAKKGKINGEMSVKGGLVSDWIKVNGQFELDGNADVKELIIRGATKVKGNLRSEKIDLLGDINVKNDCNSEAFISRGVFIIGGLLNAENIDIELYDKCQVREIGGETIHIKRIGKSLFNRALKFMIPLLGFEGELATDTIEGDDVYIEYTTAKVVRGNNVRIGPGCDIGLVEYRDSFEQDKTAQVQKHLKAGN